MSQTMTAIQGPAEPSFLRLARIGVWAATAALCVACLAFAVFVWGAANDHMTLSSDVIEAFGIGAYTERLSGPVLWLGTFFWSWVDVLGIAMLWQVRALFITYRDGAVFTAAAASRLRLIGWIVLALAPVSILGNLLGGMSVSAWITGDAVHGQIAIQDADIYAIVIGMVIVSVGHVMTRAAELDAENRAFV
jgi:hypothetical protein